MTIRTVAAGPDVTTAREARAELDRLTTRLAGVRFLLAEARAVTADDDAELPELTRAADETAVLERQERDLADRITRAQENLRPFALTRCWLTPACPITSGLRGAVTQRKSTCPRISTLVT